MAIIFLPAARQELDRLYYEALEAGATLQFTLMPMLLTEEDLQVLQIQRQSRAAYHKQRTCVEGRHVASYLLGEQCREERHSGQRTRGPSGLAQ